MHNRRREGNYTQYGRNEQTRHVVVEPTMGVTDGYRVKRRIRRKYYIVRSTQVSGAPIAVCRLAIALRAVK